MKKNSSKVFSFSALSFSFFCAIALLLSCAAFIEASDVVIQKIDIEGLHSIKNDELLELLGLRTGDVLDPVSVRNGIKMAFLKGIFEDISVELEDAGKGHIKIKVKEADIISNIYIKGNRRLKKKTLAGIFLFKEDRVMRYDLIEYSIGELKKTLAEKGFVNADIKVKVEKTRKPYRINLVLTIDEGRPEIINLLRIYGPEEEVRRIMKITEGDIYDQFEVRREMENIRAYYKKNNYLNPSVGPYAFADGELVIDINPGRKLHIEFEGNRSASSSELRKETPFFDAEDFRDDLVEEAVSRITALYHDRGYAFAQVAPVITSGEDAITVTFFIFEGDKVIVNSIKFVGISVPGEDLKEVMSLKEGDLYNPDLIDADSAMLTEFYHSMGYLGMSIGDVRTRMIEDSAADITITIKEGEKTSIEDIDIKGAEYISKEEIEGVIGIKTGSVYDEVDVSNARYRIIELYGSYGFADSKVEIKQEFGEKGVRVIFEINEGMLSFFGKTVISGNEDTKYEVIKRELQYKEGSPYNYTLVTKTRRRLYRLGLFTDVDIDAVDKDAGIRDIHLRVKEGNAGAVEFGVGYGDYERQRGSFDISYRNLFGMNRQLSFRTELSTLEQRYIINYLEPWFLDSSIPFRMLFIKESRTEKNISTRETRYKLKRNSASAGFEKRLSEKLKGEIFYEFALVKTYEVQPDIILAKEDTGTLTISGIKPGLIYDTRDNPFDPSKGLLAGISVKAASGVLLSETDFIKLILNGSTYKELSKYFVFALSLKYGMAQGYGDTRDLPLVERFFLGGRSTARGYEQDTLGPKGVNGSPTGGNAFFLGNVELRTSLGKTFGLVTFLDGGNVWRRTNDVDLSELKYTAGMGIRYNTPVGPIRVDYGFKLDREEGESRGEVHFTIGHAF
ncbi:MAG: outer membrane protein assembly factor BamA [Nitrospirae bacterium]|nr:MAG: outer membrane protein assembly factor BamA [Nitrospirota bacterium]